MLKARVHAPGVDVVSPGELTDAAETLERAVVDYLSLPVVGWDEPVDRTTEFVSAIRVGHLGKLRCKTPKKRHNSWYVFSCPVVICGLQGKTGEKSPPLRTRVRRLTTP